MRGLWRPLLVVVLALLVPILPFLGFGEALEATITGWLDPPPAPATVALLTVALLGGDIVLPVPSSLLSTFAASQLGFFVGTLVSWMGMTLGAIVGFYAARTWGRSLAARLTSVDDLQRMDRLGQRYGVGIVIITRALPVLAEAAVLLVGATHLEWRRFVPAMMLANLGIAVVYSALGAWAQTRHELPLALGASIALPILAAALARRFLR